MSSTASADPFGAGTSHFSTSHALDRAPKRWSRQVAMDLVTIAEAMSVILGCMLPAGIYATAGGIPVQWTSVFQVGCVAAIIVVICLRGWGMYDTHSLADLPQRPTRLLGALILSCLAIVGLGLPVPSVPPHAVVWYTTWIMLTFTLMLLVRMVAHAQLHRLAAMGRFDERIAVYGAGTIARQVHDHLSSARNGISFAGAFDDRTEKERQISDGLAVKGRLEDLVALGRTGGVDRIVVALPASASIRIEEVARKLEQLPVSLHVVTHIASDLIKSGPAHAVSAIGPIGLLDVKKRPLADWQPLIKSFEDYVLGALLTVLTLPLFALIAIAIKLDSSGPVLFVQRRKGLNQSVIPVLKFRTMHVMEDGGRVTQATRNDPRVTRVGRLLRASSLGELPQLINVLRGEMSLVGPRPHAIAHDEHYGDLLDGYVNRHQVKPGITGLAQVRGFRGETRTTDKMKSRIDNDLEYITAWSPWLDMKILYRTIFAVLRGDNAH
jgi:Undecaprenyl-phosphate glucose phosphotransferase